MRNENIGQKIRFVRKPTSDEWKGIGEIPFSKRLEEAIEKGLPLILQDIHNHFNSIYIEGEDGWWPIVCFELYSAIKDNYSIF